MKDKVSIVIPTFNREKLIIGCLNSIIKQTYNNIEIIIVDDGSTDNTESVIENYINSNNQFNIKYFKQKNNGAPSARNLGLKQSTGDYIVFFDSDDFMEIDRIKKQIKCISQNSADACVCGFRNINCDFTWLPKDNYSNPLYSLINGDLYASTQIWMYKRSYINVIMGYDESLVCSQDFDITFRYLLYNDVKLCVIQEPLSIFNDHNGSERIMKLWNTSKGIISKNYLNRKCLQSLARLNSLYIFTYNRIFFNSLFILRKNRLIKEYQNQIYFYKKTIKTYPNLIRIILRILLSANVIKVNIKYIIHKMKSIR